MGVWKWGFQDLCLDNFIHAVKIIAKETSLLPSVLTARMMAICYCICLRIAYALSGTDSAYAAISMTVSEVVLPLMPRIASGLYQTKPRELRYKTHPAPLPLPREIQRRADYLCSILVSPLLPTDPPLLPSVKVLGYLPSIHVLDFLNDTYGAEILIASMFGLCQWYNPLVLVADIPRIQAAQRVLCVLMHRDVGWTMSNLGELAWGAQKLMKELLVFDWLAFSIAWDLKSTNVCGSWYLTRLHSAKACIEPGCIYAMFHSSLTLSYWDAVELNPPPPEPTQEDIKNELHELFRVYALGLPDVESLISRKAGYSGSLNDQSKNSGVVCLVSGGGFSWSECADSADVDNVGTIETCTRLATALQRLSKITYSRLALAVKPGPFPPRGQPELRYLPTHFPATCLRACYDMSGTHAAHGTTRSSTMSLSEFLALLKSLRLVPKRLSLSDASAIFRKVNRMDGSDDDQHEFDGGFLRVC
eukprot:2564779-Rhodomonas_salina.1